MPRRNPHSRNTRRQDPRHAISETLERRVLLSNAWPVGAEFRVNTYTTNAQSSPSVAADAAGNFVVVWSGTGEGDASGIFARRFNRAGTPLGDEFRINTSTTNHQGSPSVAMDAAGDFVVAWSGAGQGDGYGVFAQRYDAAGLPQGDQFRVNTYTTDFQDDPSVAMDADGDFVIVWTSLYQGGEGRGVYAQRYNAAGVPQGVEFRVNSTLQSYPFPSVAMDADGDFVVTWMTGHGYGATVYAHLYDAAGVPQGEEFRVNTSTSSFGNFPAVAMDADGNFVIAWTGGESIYGSPTDIYAQRYNAAGAPQGGEFRVNSTQRLFPLSSVAIDADGDFVVTWANYYGSDVYAQRYNAAGVPQGGEFRVNTSTTNLQSAPTVAMDADGDFVITWTNWDGYNINYTDVFAQHYAVLPQIDSSAFLFDSSPHRLRFNFSRDVRDSLSVDDLVVENLTTGQTIPSGQFALLYDADYNVATFMYLGSGSLIGGVLPDGNYCATLLASGITTPAGASLADDHDFEFFFLNGDANRDGVVNLADFNRLARNFGQSGTDFTRGDFTYDGSTDLADFNILVARFGMALPGTAISTVFASMRTDPDDWLREWLNTDPAPATG